VTPRRLIGIDYGEKRIGIAASDGALAVPVTILEHTSRGDDLDRVADIILEREADAVVVGLPLHSSGDEGEQARRCRRFAESLARSTGLPVEYQDETLSSVTAEAAVRELPGVGHGRHSRSVDDHAAARILQAYLDERESSA
jgi:putative Holliday junction resolvase